MKNQRGGQRSGSGRPPNLKRGLPDARTWQDYETIRLPKPTNDRESAALEWFKNLEPFERLQLIIRFYTT